MPKPRQRGAETAGNLSATIAAPEAVAASPATAEEAFSEARANMATELVAPVVLSVAPLAVAVAEVLLPSREGFAEPLRAQLRPRRCGA